ncbi:hypothetical protein [Cupriavidus plantarum]|uniref:hypothetical protein n=1 Tax=Cupriavidus plantarum TaxID=942865 RepID=UPI00339D72D4
MEKITLSITVEDEIYEKLRAAAEKEGVTVEQYHLELLEDAYPQAVSWPRPARAGRDRDPSLYP